MYQIKLKNFWNQQDKTVQLQTIVVRVRYARMENVSLQHVQRMENAITEKHVKMAYVKLNPANKTQIKHVPKMRNVREANVYYLRALTMESIVNVKPTRNVPLKKSATLIPVLVLLVNVLNQFKVS